MNFLQCVQVCAANDALVAEFNRLTGRQFGKSQQRSDLDRLIDEATGYSGENEDDIEAFIAFVQDAIWSRLPEDVR